MILPNIVTTNAMIAASTATTNTILRRRLLGRFGGVISGYESGGDVLKIGLYDSTDETNSKFAELVQFIKANPEKAEYASWVDGDRGVELKVDDVTFKLSSHPNNSINKITVYEEGRIIAEAKGFFDTETRLLWDEVLGTLESKKEAEDKQRDKDKIDAFCFLVDEALKPRENTTESDDTKKTGTKIWLPLGVLLIGALITIPVMFGYGWVIFSGILILCLAVLVYLMFI